MARGERQQQQTKNDRVGVAQGGSRHAMQVCQKDPAGIMAYPSCSCNSTFTSFMVELIISNLIQVGSYNRANAHQHQYSSRHETCQTR